jgi:hypothetical protein
VYPNHEYGYGQEKLYGFVEEGYARQGNSNSDGHRVSDNSVRPAHDKSARWVQGYWRAPTDPGKDENAPQGDNRPAESNYDTGHLNDADRQRPGDSKTREKLT